jgi:hypothetical protein
MIGVETAKGNQGLSDVEMHAQYRFWLLVHACDVNREAVTRIRVPRQLRHEHTHIRPIKCVSQTTA